MFVYKPMYSTVYLIEDDKIYVQIVGSKVPNLIKNQATHLLLELPSLNAQLRVAYMAKSYAAKIGKLLRIMHTEQTPHADSLVITTSDIFQPRRELNNIAPNTHYIPLTDFGFVNVGGNLLDISNALGKIQNKTKAGE